MIEPSFIQIPYEVYSDERLQPLDWALYGFIYWLARLANNKCTASNPTLAGLCHVKQQSIANALVRLEESECILRIYADEKKKTRKEIVPLIDYRRVYSNKETVYLPEETVYSNKYTSKPEVYSNEYENKKEELKKKSKEEVQAIFQHWNEQKITVHQSLSIEAEKEIEKLLKKKSVLEIKNLISLFGTVYRGPQYFWTHKWNLYEFLKRGTARFDGKIPQDFIRAGAQTTAPKQY